MEAVRCMPDSVANVYLHFVWATKWREGAIPADLERDLHRIIEGEVRRLGCQVIAVGGTENHVHLFVKFGRNVSFSRFMEQVKGVTSRFLNENSPAILDDPDKTFHWQPGYGVFSVGRNQIDPVIAYVRSQREHHATGNTHPDWEPPDETHSN